MTDETRSAIGELLDQNSTLTLATSKDGMPWAATVFFAHNSDFDLYFVSDHRTRHGQHMADNDRVAAAINPDCDAWAEVRGLQLEGRVTVLKGAARLAALGHYLAKFKDVKALFDKPKDKNEATIAERLRNAQLYKIQPEWIRLIDNSRWFGYKEELRLDGDKR